MLEMHARVAKYNIVNIVSTIALCIIQVLNLSFWLDWYLIFLDGDEIKVLLFWPIILLGSIILLNKSLMRKFIHLQNKHMYAANNVNIDLQKDSGSIPNSAWYALPTSSVYGLNVKRHADMEFFGTLDDIGIKYSLDEFKYQLTYKQGDSTHTAGSVDGEALVVKIQENKFGSDWTLYINDMVNFTNMVYEQSKQVPIQVGNEKGIISYNDSTQQQELQLISSILKSNEAIFTKHGQVIAMFKEDMLIYITTKGSKFKMKIPFIITKPKLEKIINDQKSQIYRFNQLLVDISRGLNM